MRTAYVVMSIDRRTLTVVGVGVYSEACPTSMHFTQEMFCETAEDYATASSLCRESLEHPAYAWARPVMERES